MTCFEGYQRILTSKGYRTIRDISANNAASDIIRHSSEAQQQGDTQMRELKELLLQAFSDRADEGLYVLPFNLSNQEQLHLKELGYIDIEKNIPKDAGPKGYRLTADGIAAANQALEQVYKDRMQEAQQRVDNRKISN